MIKFLYCVRRKPELSPEAFLQYWVEKHGPLVRRYAGALRAKKYVQSHFLESPLNQIAQAARGTGEPYDGLTEVWWESEADLAAAMSTPEGQEANRLLAEDEARFVDLSRSIVFFTREHVVFDETPARS